MLREEQIDLRRRRARAESLTVTKVDAKTRVFGAYRVINPKTGGDYVVSLRGFDTGDNACTCPDFKANTLGTCKHVEAVLEHLHPEAPDRMRGRKAAVTRPEVHVHYGEQLTLALALPPRRSDPLARLAKRYFDAKGLWSAGEAYDEFFQAAAEVPEQITFDSDALDFIDQAVDRRRLLESGQQLLEAIQRGETPEAVRDLLTAPLYDYQLIGAVFAASHGRSILGDDMGLGKTLQALAAVELLARLRGITKVLVVAPASVKYQWAGEIARFTRRNAQVVDGDRPDRLELYHADCFYRLVNYEQVTRDLAELNATAPDLVILDEAQRIKNWESKTSRAVKKLRSRYVLVLTGTPLENKLEELYSIVEVVDDRRLGPAFQFLHDHRVIDAKGNLTGYRNLEAIRARLAPIFLRRTRSEVLDQLPPRSDNSVFVELADQQRGPYEEQRSALARLLSKPVMSDLDRRRVLACLTNLRLICNSTFLYDKSTHVAPKLDEFTELVPQLLAEAADRKLVVFSQWEQTLREAAGVLEKLGVDHALLHGRLPASKREEPIERFKSDPECRVFLSTDAGGTGLNLQAADTVIHLEVPWNPAVMEQRIARVHRLGQPRPVRVIRLITRNTIEERVLAVLEQKRSLFAGLFEGDTDEVAFGGPNQAAFIDELRSAVGVGAAPAATAPPASDRLQRAAIEMLDAVAELLEGPIDPQLAQRGRQALARLTQALNPSE